MSDLLKVLSSTIILYQNTGQRIDMRSAMIARSSWLNDALYAGTFFRDTLPAYEQS